MTRTGLLFPEESRPATEGFSGFGGGSSSSASASTSRRGSDSSISSMASQTGVAAVRDVGNQFLNSGGVVGANQYINRPVFTISEEERLRKLNPALMVLTHPELEAWHKTAIREAVGEYGIGIIFVSLFKTEGEQDDEGEKDDEEEIPILRPLDPSTIRGFTSFDALRAATGRVDGGRKLRYGKGKAGNLEEEMRLDVDVGGSTEEIIEEVVEGVRDVMYA